MKKFSFIVLILLTTNNIAYADMDASDTAVVKMHIPNTGSAQSDVVGSNKTTFSGFLAC